MQEAGNPRTSRMNFIRRATLSTAASSVGRPAGPINPVRSLFENPGVAKSGLPRALDLSGRQLPKSLKEKDSNEYHGEGG